MSERTLRLAKRTADTRRTLLRLFGPELGERTALDLMGVPDPTPEQQTYARVVAGFSLQALQDARLYLADHDMVSMLDTAAPLMPDQPLRDTDVPERAGFVYMAEPLPDRSTPGAPDIHAFSWALAHENHPLVAARGGAPAVVLTAYVRTTDHVAYLGYDLTVMPEGLPGYMANASVAWNVDTLIGEAFGTVPDDAAKATPGFYQRLAAAFWTLSSQPKMTSTTREPSGRPTDHRKWRRAGIADAAADVRVVSLRRSLAATAPAAGERAGSERRLSVRFPISGHWRNQWFSSVEEHRHIWIDPHWKGPEDAPVVGTERVFLATAPQSPPPAGD